MTSVRGKGNNMKTIMTVTMTIKDYIEEDEKISADMMLDDVMEAIRKCPEYACPGRYFVRDLHVVMTDDKTTILEAVICKKDFSS